MISPNVRHMFKRIPSSHNVPFFIKPSEAKKQDQGFSLSPTTMATTVFATGLIVGAVVLNLFEENEEKDKK